MPPVRVDFYLLSSSEQQAKLLLACRLLEKAYVRNHRVFVFCANQQEAQMLDELLWTFKEDSFIPHNLQGEGPEPPPAVQIGFGQEPRVFNDILLNLSHEIPSFHHRFKRIMEIVEANDTAREISREHYREYRKQGFLIHTHAMKEQTL